MKIFLLLFIVLSLVIGGITWYLSRNWVAVVTLAIIGSVLLEPFLLAMIPRKKD